MAVLLGLSLAAGAETLDWQIIGRQGLVQFVIVPQAQIADAAAYDAELAKICLPNETCFVNFYANSTGAKPELPLPDAIANEPTATFRRSMKANRELFRWSCRLKVNVDECF